MPCVRGSWDEPSGCGCLLLLLPGQKGRKEGRSGGERLGRQELKDGGWEMGEERSGEQGGGKEVLGKNGIINRRMSLANSNR